MYIIIFLYIYLSHGTYREMKISCSFEHNQGLTIVSPYLYIGLLLSRNYVSLLMILDGFYDVKIVAYQEKDGLLVSYSL